MIEEIVRDGQLRTAIGAMLLVAMSLVMERAAVGQGYRWYFDASGPLVEQPLPIPHAPVYEGEERGIRWARHRDGLRWWVERGAKGAPGGLHGTVVLVPHRHGLALEFRWCPPWTPFLALAWFAGLGAVESRIALVWPIATVLAGGIFLVYRQSAVRLAARLRYRWARDPRGEEAAPAEE